MTLLCSLEGPSCPPVGHDEPILANVGSKRVMGFYVPGSGTCGVQAVVWNGNDTDAVSAARIRVNLTPMDYRN